MLALLDRLLLGLFALGLGYTLAAAINAALVLAHWP
jgi:hypothetical protein